MKENNRNSVAFITGASRGIGYAIARRLAPMCSNLFVASQKKKNIMAAAQKLREETGSLIHPLWGDLVKGRSYADSAKRLVEATTKRIDILVLNAAYYVEGSLAEIADEDFARNMLINCHSAHYVVSALLPFLMKSPSGRIVMIGSAAAYEASPIPTYGIAKWGLRGYAVNLRKELMEKNIGVTFLSPGGTLTDMWEDDHIPAGRLLEPDDIGKLVAAVMTLSPQAVVEELIVRPMLGDIYEYE
jgi:short-subunit dehydrogenase